MKALDVLDQASAAEAEMARAARQCIMAALDNSNAPAIRLIIEDDGSGQGRPAPALELPPKALRFFADVCSRRSKSEPPCRLNREPGVEADAEMVGCG